MEHTVTVWFPNWPVVHKVTSSPVKPREGKFLTVSAFIFIEIKD